ncbi:MAG: TolB family protein, partial [bacterium]
KRAASDILHSGEHSVDVVVGKPPLNRRWVPMVLVLAGLAGGVLLGRMVPRGAESGSAAAVRFTQEAPPGTRITSGGVLSPDGRQLAFVASDVQSGTTRLWARTLTSAEATAIPGTESAERPFWSPDGQTLGFVANGRLKTVSLSGENLRNLAAVRSFAGGATWGPNIILFSNWRAGLDSVAPWGGPASPMTTLDAAMGEIQHRMPHFLPDSRRYLFYVTSAKAERAGVYVGTTGSSERIRLLDGSHEAAI